MRTDSDGNTIIRLKQSERLVNLLSNLNYDLLFKESTNNKLYIFQQTYISPISKIRWIFPQNILYDHKLLCNVKVIFSCSEAGLCSVCLQVIYFLFYLFVFMSRDKMTETPNFVQSNDILLIQFWYHFSAVNN